MHNKTFTVDNQVTIVGGRNLADEYYQTGGKTEFIDEDLLVIGPRVDDVSDGFDEYWDSPEAIPMAAFDRMVAHSGVDESIEEARRYVDEHIDTPFLKGVDGRLIEDFIAGRLALVGGEAEVVQDRPDKVQNFVRRRASVTTDYLQKMVSAANEELIVISPYFVPQKQGVDFFGKKKKKGVRVVIISNSLASTNHSSVHAVYARYRKPLLRQGVELYELRPSFDAMKTDTKLTLHSKVATVDRQRMFVGSFNIDPRSLYLNTEMGMAVNSSELSSNMATSILDSLPESAYKLRLSRKGRLQWLLQTAGVEEVITTEPQTSLLRRFLTKLMSFLPIEEQM
jgi:putative cardiolipin synthase